jgi:hypothetical protein
MGEAKARQKKNEINRKNRHSAGSAFGGITDR